MKKLITITLFAFFSQNISAQDESDVISKAMRDEIQRNLSELIKKDHEKPFFISYAVSDAKILQINGMLGGIFNSNLDSIRSWYSRVMVGGYEINDENFNDPQFSPSSYIDYPEVPIENDYSGIRRSLWIATNNIYEEAARLYKSKKESYQKYNITPTINDFSKTEVVKLYQKQELTSPDKDKYENLVKELSSYFKEHPNIFKSDVSFSLVKANAYFLNSEGTEYVIPYNLSSLTINAQLLSSSGEIIADKAFYMNEDPETFISNQDQIKVDLKNMIDNLYKVSALPSLPDDNYIGPVLIINQLVSDFFNQNLNQGNSSIIADRPELEFYNQNMAEIYFSDISKNLKSESRKISGDGLIVTAYPRLKSYKNNSLMGNIEIDAEGTVPPDTIVLIKDGKLVRKLNGRTPAVLALNTNGHQRKVFVGGGFTTEVAPSVLKIDFSTKNDIESLKNQLINQAKNQGMDYALVLKPEFEFSTNILTFTKINVKDGSEEIVRSRPFNLSSPNILQKIEAVSPDYYIDNYLWDNYGSGNSAVSGVPATNIVPNALLIRELEINVEQNQYYNKYFPSIPGPLK